MAWIIAFADWAGSRSALAIHDELGWAEEALSPRFSGTSGTPGSVLATHPDVKMNDWSLARGPYRYDVAGLAVVADATLYNADELGAELGLPTGTSTPELLACGFDRWDVSLPTRLIGDFAFVIWDSRRRTMFAARDPFGVRSLVYREVSGGGLIATDVEQLLLRAHAPVVPDGVTILEYLTWDCRERDRTFFRDIHKVPAGHSLRWTARGARVTRYWQPPDHEIAMGKSEDYHREFRRLFLQAVGDRLMGDKPVLAHLSGGLDSSSIVCSADLLVRHGRGARVKAVSAVYPGLACDETPFIEAVTRQISIPCESWNGTLSTFSDLLDPSLAWPAGRTTQAGGTHGDISIALRDGAATVLSGSGGDQIGSSVGILRDLGATHQWARLVRESAFKGPGSLLQRITRTIDSAGGAAPASAVHGLRYLRSILRPFLVPEQPTWLSKELRQLALERRLQGGFDERAFLSNLQRRRWVELNNPALGWSIERQYRGAALHGIEMRFPFLDVRLARFVLAVPFAFWGVGRYPERFHRTALADLLPNEILARRQKTRFDDALSHRLRGGAALLREIVGGPERWASSCYVDREGARQLLSACREPVGASFWDQYHLWQIATVEAWLRRVLG